MATAADHMLYIQEKVNPVLEQLVTQLLLERPDEPTGFMVQWLKEKHGQTGFPPIQSSTGMETVEELQKQIETLTARKQELEAKLG